MKSRCGRSGSVLMAATHLRQIRRFPPLSRCQRRRAVGGAGVQTGWHDDARPRRRRRCAAIAVRTARSEGRQAYRGLRYPGSDDRPICASGPGLDPERRCADHREHRREPVVRSGCRRHQQAMSANHLRHPSDPRVFPRNRRKIQKSVYLERDQCYVLSC